MKPTATGGPYGPVTKSIDISEALMLIGLARELPDVHSWREEAMIRLPQASHKRRQEIVHDVQAKFLDVEGNRFADSPLATLLAVERLSANPSTVEKTRNHITAHLTKFGLLEARAVPGDRIAKRFYARFYEPDAQAFWLSLALEFDARGWTSRSLDFVANTSWTRIAYCATPAFVRFAVEEAERAGLVVTDFFGSEKQVTLRGPEPVARIAEAIMIG